MGRLAGRSANKGIDNPINNLPVLEPTGSRHALPNKTTVLKHAHRGRVPLKHWRLKANEVKARHDMRNDEPYRFSHDAAAPVRFAQPVTELSGLDVSTFSQRDADAARGVTVNLDRPMRGFGHGLKKREPPFGIGLRIRVRESVCEVAPNIAVVREPQQRAFVASRPVANHALGALDLHPRIISFGRLTFAPTRRRGKWIAEVRRFSPVAVGRAVRCVFHRAPPEPPRTKFRRIHPLERPQPRWMDGVSPR